MSLRTILNLCCIGGLTSFAAALQLRDVNVTQAVLNEGGFASGCAQACAALHSIYGPAQVFTNKTEPASYATFTAAYWSVNQADVRPICIFEPTSAQEVSTQIEISRLTQCPFAVKSGGHSAFAGAASSIGGITVSLEKLTQIILHDKSGTVSIGPGNKWIDVYSTLQAHDVATIGGRVAPIGVGGLTLGGGISFFSNIYGWACDNVASYEVVLADGSIVKASPSSNQELFFALRGGGPNFGIVTSFEVKTIPLPKGLMWGGALTHSEDKTPALINAFVNMGTTGIEQDPNAAQIFSFVAYNGSKITSTFLTYAKPVANASVFSEYLAVPEPLGGYEDLSVRTLASLTLELQRSNPDGLRETYWTAVYKLTPDMSNSSQAIFFEEIESILDAPGVLPALSLQTITKAQVRPMAQNGGNPLGLNEHEAPYLLIDLSVWWSDAADDQRILKACHSAIEKSNAYAKANGYYTDYLYMNYASQFQDVISSYGASNKARLQQVAKKYDPEGVFQKLQPGYFKLAGPPARWPTA